MHDRPYCPSDVPQYSGRGLYYHYYYYYHHHQQQQQQQRISHFSASAWKHSPTLGYVINRIRLGGLIYNVKSLLQLNVLQELHIFASVCTYSDAG